MSRDPSHVTNKLLKWKLEYEIQTRSGRKNKKNTPELSRDAYINVCSHRL